jgi:hypothetical protein
MFPRIELQTDHTFYTGQPPEYPRVTLCQHIANTTHTCDD